jgi:hypothetical protein
LIDCTDLPSSGWQRPDGLGTLLGLAAAGGVPAGAAATHRGPRRTAVGLACATAGTLLLVRAALA